MSESSTETQVTKREASLYEWLRALPLHTVVGMRETETAMDTWWYRLDNKYYRMGTSEALNLSEIVSQHGGEIFWIESIPMKFLGEIFGNMMMPARWEEEKDDAEVS